MSEATGPRAGGGAFHRVGSGEPMVLVHGITDTWRTWELVLPRLAPHHDAMAVTLLGHSGGRVPGADGRVELSDLVDEVEADMDAAGFETAHLAGNSLGGWIVLELAARGRARSVVALSPAGGWDPGDRWALAGYWQLIAQQRLLAATAPLAENLARRPRGRWVVLGGLVSDPPAVPAPLATALVRGAADCPAAVPLLLESRAHGYPELAAIDCPVRIAWGTRDYLLPVKHLSARFRRLVPQADWVEIDGAGHLPQIDHPERTAELILELSAPAGS